MNHTVTALLFHDTSGKSEQENVHNLCSMKGHTPDLKRSAGKVRQSVGQKSLVESRDRGFGGPLEGQSPHTGIWKGAP